MRRAVALAQLDRRPAVDPGAGRAAQAAAACRRGTPAIAAAPTSVGCGGIAAGVLAQQRDERVDVRRSHAST